MIVFVKARYKISFENCKRVTSLMLAAVFSKTIDYIFLRI